MRVRVVFAILLIAVLGQLGLQCDRDVAPRPANLILISVDTLRADHLGAYGYRRDTSPTLDRLAREGALFESVVADSSWTLPTHATLFTGVGQGTHRVGFGGNRLEERHRTIAERLKARGYRTGGFWSGPYLHPFFGFGQGFDVYEGVLGELYLDDAERVDGSKTHQMNLASHESITSPAVIDAGIDFVERAGDEPFFLFLHLFDPHYDFMPPDELWRRFDPDYRGTITSYRFAFSPLIHPGMDPRDLEHLVALYDGEILFTDQHIGRLVDALDRRGLAEDTVIAVTADHGEEFFEHGQKGHRNHLHDEVVKVPWIVRGRDVKPGRRIAEQVRHVDVAPTLLGLLGEPAREDEVMGMDLSGVLRGDDAAPREVPAVSRLMREKNEVHAALRTRAWKYIRIEREGEPPVEQWFDLAVDTGERDPSATDPAPVTQARDWLSVISEYELAIVPPDDPSGDPERPSAVPNDIEEQLRQMGYIK